MVGGGSSLVHALRGIEAKKHENGASSAADEKFGWDIIRPSLEVPLRHIAEIAGFEGSVEVQKVESSLDKRSKSMRFVS